MNRAYLVSLLSKNALVISFTRKTPPIGQVRVMICTKSNYILNSFQGRVNLNFRSPHSRPKFRQVTNNVIVVWDILMQDYRLIPANSVMIMDKIPNIKFWQYYNEFIYPMSSREKLEFMNKV